MPPPIVHDPELQQPVVMQRVVFGSLVGRPHCGVGSLQPVSQMSGENKHGSGWQSEPATHEHEPESVRASTPVSTPESVGVSGTQLPLPSHDCIPGPRHGVPAATLLVNMHATGPTGVEQRLIPFWQRFPPRKHAVAGSTQRATHVDDALHTIPAPHAL